MTEPVKENPFQDAVAPTEPAAEEVAPPTEVEEQTDEVANALQQQKEQVDMQFRAEVKHYAAQIIAGIKSNTGRSSKDIEHVKESVRLAMLLVNYVNHMPLNFDGHVPPQG